MKIEIFGTGCMKCRQLEENVRKVVEQIGIDAEIVKITDIETMIDRGLMATPGLAVNGKLVVAGRVPSNHELIEIIKTSGGRS